MLRPLPTRPLACGGALLLAAVALLAPIRSGTAHAARAAVSARVAPGDGATRRIGTRGRVTTLAGRMVWPAGARIALGGSLRVAAGARLDIGAGAVIEAAPGVSIVVDRGGQLQVTGTLLQPVVFTCPNNASQPGCWDGLTILGNAPINGGTATSPAGPRGGVGACNESALNGDLYGGCNPLDDSGALRFARVQYATYGLRVYGVGSATALQDIQVHRSLGSGLEVVGGTAQFRHLVLTGNAQYGLRYSDGWQGQAQYVIIQQDPTGYAGGLLGRNNVLTNDALPRSAPTLANFTIITPASAPTNPYAGAAPAALRFERGAAAQLYNLLVIEPGIAVDIDDTATCNQLNSTALRAQGIGVTAPGSLIDPDADPAACAPLGEADLLAPATVVTGPAAATQLVGALSVLLPDLRPAAGSIIANVVGVAPPSGGLLEPVTTLGAVGAAGAAGNAIPWYAGWTIGEQLAPPALVTLAGVVSAPGRGGLGGVTVQVLPSGATAVTDALGQFSVPGVVAGPVEVNLTAGVPADCQVPGVLSAVAAAGAAPVQVLLSCAPPTAVLSGSIAVNRTLSPDTVYVIRGFVYVNSGATLTVNAGTKLVGDTTAPGSSLFVLRGSRIVANGTAGAPIVFTSQRSPGNRSPGDWGGLIIVGNARVNRTGNVIVEGSNGAVLGANPSGVAYSGGTNDADNSGTLRYVRVEFGGYATLSNTELNSFTFAAVGSGTTVEYVQALAGLDDNFEWMGGTVDGKYLVSYEAGDDHFDTAEGYRGRNQFLIAFQSAFIAPKPGAGSNSTDPHGFEIDGCNGGGCVAPAGASAQSAGRDDGLWNMNVFANFTIVGAGAAPTPVGGGIGLLFRRGTGGSYLNGVVARWPGQAISLRDSTSNNRFQVDSLIVRNLFFANNGLQNSGVIFDPVGTNFGQAAAFAARNSSIDVAAVAVSAASLFQALPTVSTTTVAADFDWSPSSGSPIATGGLSTFSGDPLIAARVGAFILPTSYRGAAAPGGAKWWANWTNYARN